MIQGFKEFILRGNVIELAVAFVIGVAFSAVVTALVDGFVNPLIGLFFNASSLDTALVVTIGSGVFHFGAILGAIINFLAVAAVVYFALVLPMNKLQQRQEAKAGATPEAPAPTQEELLAEIRDLLAKNTAS